MAESINIDVFRNKTADEFTAALKDPNSKLNSGSAAAESASFAAALANRATGLILTNTDSDELQYIFRNTEVIRNYMVHLIDEDVKCKGPMRRALKEGGKDEIEAARHPACAICGEIINMMVQLFDFLKALKRYSDAESCVYLRQSAYFAFCSMSVARDYILYIVSDSSDETFRYVSRRENEITFEECRKVYLEVIS